jgi:hypothetical protein
MPEDCVRNDLRLFASAQLEIKIEQLCRNLSFDDRVAEVDRLVERLLQVEVEDNVPPFLWVCKMIETLNKCDYLKEIDETLSVDFLPNALWKVYARILMRIEMTILSTPSSVSLEFLSKLLSWAAYAKQPLTLDWLQSITSSWGKPLSHEQIRERILETCGSLFVFRSHTANPREDTLHFIHFSAKEFLQLEKSKIVELCDNFAIFKEGKHYKSSVFQQKLLSNSTESHRQIFSDCISFLVDTRNEEKLIFAEPLVSVRGDAVRAQDVFTRYPFLGYAARYWPYHLVRAKDFEIQQSLLQLTHFFRTKQSLTWMEAAIAFEDDIFWVRGQVAVLQSWIREHKSKAVKRTEFDQWAKDVTSRGFSDFETTLRYNPNDIHFVDRKWLFPRLQISLADDSEERDRIFELPKDLSTERDPLFGGHSPRVIDHHLPEQLDQNPLALPASLDLGENDHEFGFVILDENQATGSNSRGLFLIDRRSNDPTVTWNCAIPYHPNIDLQPEPRTLVNKISSCKKIDPHKLWLCFSGTLDYTGTRLAAVFGETVAPKRQGPATVRLKTIIWNFHGADDRELALWKEGFEKSRSDYENAVKLAFENVQSNELNGDSSSQTNRKRLENILDRVKHTGRIVQNELSHRPQVPSILPVEQGQRWASAKELYEHTDDYPTTDVLLSSRYLIAFRGNRHLVTLKGLFDLKSSKYICHYAISEVTVQMVIVPRGDDILRFRDSEMQVLDIIDPTSFTIRKSIHISIFKHYKKFGEIIDCSSSGRLIAITLTDTLNGIIGLAILDLQEESFKILPEFKEKSTQGGFRFTRAFFCPRDMHVFVGCSRAVVQEQHEKFVVDISQGLGRKLNFSDKPEFRDSPVSSVVCANCSYSGDFQTINGTPIVFMQSDNVTCMSTTLPKN